MGRFLPLTQDPEVVFHRVVSEPHCLWQLPGAPFFRRGQPGPESRNLSHQEGEQPEGVPQEVDEVAHSPGRPFARRLHSIGFASSTTGELFTEMRVQTLQEKCFKNLGWPTANVGLSMVIFFCFSLIMFQKSRLN